MDEGVQVAQALMQALGIRADGLITGAYIDLLEERAAHG